MRSTHLTFCAAAVVAATLVPASAALADSGSGSAQEKDRASLTATPSSTVPGGEVDLRLEGCKGREATGRSDVFVSEARFSPAADGGLFAEARISSDASPGDHDIRVDCKDDKGAGATGTVTVVDRGRATPLAPVAAGGGGTALFAGRDARQEGPGTVHAVIGLVLAAVAAVAVAFRSARRRRPATD
ncbi:hypothetical protein [Streptomyces sp. NBC_01363]|uniref:hypothetical protein n=1 Tax=Streptomyces sp. NBC_01363 TaxID=2903840 RepID=UPI0022578612|nr:hypothetical protein [Streptomyces sp. NBC_01363]MCX4731903.1 hypothetical protein [Streptomyces sp. NBC_01363]